jgi:hypothetical protein
MAVTGDRSVEQKDVEAAAGVLKAIQGRTATPDQIKMLAAPVAHASLAEALSAFQAECPPVRKTSTANVSGTSRGGQPVNYKYAYADLSAIHEVIDPIKGKHGLSFSSKPTMAKGEFVLKYKLRHVSGESIKGVWPLGDVRGMNPQEVGKLITYFRRYAECSVLGIAPGGDDDGGESAPKRQEQKRQEQPRRAEHPRSEDAPVDWDYVLERARDTETVEGLRKLAQVMGLASAPVDVKKKFEKRVLELKQKVAKDWEPKGEPDAEPEPEPEPDDNPLHYTDEELKDQT